MPPAPSYPSTYLQPASLRRRATSFLLAAIANILLVGMLLTLAPDLSPIKRVDRTPATFELLPEKKIEPTRAKSKTKTKRPSGGAGARKPAPAPAAAKVPTETPPETPLNMIIVSKDVLDRTDLAMRTKNSSAQAASGDSGGGREGSGTSEGPGQGPGGEHLYNAEWQREPTDAELSFYMPKSGPRVGWGEIGCRTISQFRVEDCVEIGESPARSGFARAVRQAAWQFRVQPPRIGGKKLIGAWVRIRITYTESGATNRP